MIRRLATLALALLPAAPAAATAQEAAPVRVGQEYERTLTRGETHRYTLELAAERFVFGTANQHDVDVVVTVIGPDGRPVATFDTPARGPEPFQFTSDAAGEYRIEVSPFEAEQGRYTLAIARVEPRATTPEGVVDQLMAAYDGPLSPGGVVAVVRDGEIRFTRGYGMADLEHGIHNTPEMRFNIGSVAKQFTAFGILLLAERGELTLEDDIRDHLPEVPDFGETIRIRHLLTHTSGLREFLNLLLIAGRDIENGDVIRRDEVLRTVQRQPALQSSPGATYLYNNTGYMLLAEIVERVSGQPFAEWMGQNVFRPLGMEATTIPTEIGALVARRAEGYTPTARGGFRRAEDLGAAWGAGGIYTTVHDLARWLTNFGEPRVGGPRLIRTMTTRGVLTSGDTIRYALGVIIDEQRGLARIQHGGNDLGHAAQLLYFPDLDAGVIVVSNLAGTHAREVAEGVAEAFFGEPMAPESEPAASPARAASDAPAVDPATLARYEGEYQLDGGPVVRFTREGETLFTQIEGQPRFAMRPLSDSIFQVEVPGIDARVVFHGAGRTPAESATLHQAGRAMPVRRLEPWSPTAADLAAYVGRYYSPEVETVYTVVAEDDGLVARHARIGEVLLTPTERDTFRGDRLALQELRFERGADGRVTGFAVSNGRTRGVRFEKQE